VEEPPLMRLIDRYVLSIFLPALGVFMGVFVALYLSIDLAGNLSKFLQITTVPVMGFVLRYYACRLPMFFTYLLPAVLLFAPMFTVVKLARSNEILPVAASGTSLRRLVLPFLIAGLLAGGLMALMDEFVLVHLAEEMADTENMAAIGEKTYNAFARDERNTLVNAVSYSGSERRLSRARIIWFDDDANQIQIVTAARCDWDLAAKRWVAFEGEIEWPQKLVRIPGEKPRTMKEPLPPAGLPLDTAITPKAFQRTGSTVDRFGFAPLADLLEEARKNPGDGRRWSKVHARLSFPLSPIILLLLGLPFVVQAHGKSFIKGLIFSFLLVLAFYMTYFAGQDMAGRGVLPHALGGWGPTAVSAVAGAVLFARLRT
jgi:lipopolysaccharide export LptBFGC system permease protein LptF